MKNLFLLIITALFLHCGAKMPKPVKPDVELFFKVYDTLMALTTADSAGLGSSAFLDSALHLHAMSKAQFDTTLAFLEKHPDQFIKALEAYDKSANQDSVQKIK
jgi:hypothetical protein